MYLQWLPVLEKSCLCLLPIDGSVFCFIWSYISVDYERPRLGCRVIVQRNFHKVLPSVLRDLSDWTVMSRIKVRFTWLHFYITGNHSLHHLTFLQASQLLYSSLTHLEEHITQSLRDLLNAMYRACCDEEQVVASNVSHHTATSMGYISCRHLLQGLSQSKALSCVILSMLLFAQSAFIHVHTNPF